MRVDVNPSRYTVTPGTAAVLTVQVFNTSPVISAHTVRVLGVDERWVTVDPPRLSMFPESSAVAVVTVRFPAGVPAGTRRIGIEVRELVEPGEVQLVAVELDIPIEVDLRLSLEPVSSTGGRAARFGVVVTNGGNTTAHVRLGGDDEEANAQFVFSPPELAMTAGERATVTARIQAPRRFAGQAKVRPFRVFAAGRQPPVEAVGTFVQKPFLSRGALSLVGLLLAVTVFALVITASLSRVVDKSSADRELALEVARAGQAGGASGSGTVSGTVSLLTTGAPIAAVTVELFDAGNTAKAVVSTATGTGGQYQFAGVAEGSYKVRFRGAGFSELWFPESLSADNAKTLEVHQGGAVPAVDVRLGGVPATIKGTVHGDAPAGATVSVATPTAPGDTGGAVVSTVAVDASGNFTLTPIPSPATYDVVVAEPGYATATERVELGGGETRTGVQLSLVKGDGSISGHVFGPAGPLPGATVTASDGHVTVTTLSLTQDDVGAFSLTSLPTPAAYTVSLSKPGFTTQTLTLALGAGQALSGVGSALRPGVGAITGKVSVSGGLSAGGVTVTVTNGDLKLDTVTLSVGDVGAYTVSGLAIPGTYTVTFARPDLAPQTRSVDLAAGGTPVPVAAALQAATGSVFGAVASQAGTPLGEVAVSLTSGDTAYNVTSASVPVAGEYRIDGVRPGTYSASFTRIGAKPVSSIVTLVAGQALELDPTLPPGASIKGTVLQLPQTADTSTTTAAPSATTTTVAGATTTVATTTTTAPPPTTAPAAATPRAGAQVRLYEAQQYPTVVYRSTTSGADGTFSFDDVNAPQDYVVDFAYPPGSAPQTSVEKEVNPSDAITLDPVTLTTG